MTELTSNKYKQQLNRRRTNMSFFAKLSQSLNEKDVENIYRSELASIDMAKITSPYAVDGLLETTTIRSLLEFKYNESLKNKLDQCNVLIQCLYYLKKFEINGEKLPSTIFVGDINECFAIHTNAIVKYLSSEIDWKIAPSEAHKRNPELVQAMVGDIDILPFVYDVNGKFNIHDVIEKIKDLSSNVVRKIRITKHNIVSIFDYFNKNVLGKIALSTNEKANLFVQIVINPGENCMHPKRKNTLMTKSFGELQVNQNLFNSFFQHFEGDIYSPKEKESLTGLLDRLVEDSVRRNKGEFFTTTSFVDLAHQYITDTFGANWKERFVVWDCAAGTLNLTRDYAFSELYVSTLEKSDIDTANQMGYNPEAVKFQYDFLNDSDHLLPPALWNAITRGKEILFLINPPYAAATNAGTKDGDHKAGVADTYINKQMIANGWGKSAQNIYAQFFYRITQMQKINQHINIGVFCPPLYLTGEAYKEFRKHFFAQFGFQKGFLFQASHFSDVSGNWGINFAVFGNTLNAVKDNFVHDLIETDNSNIDLHVVGQKTIYNSDYAVSCSEWVRREVKGVKTYDAPQLSSAMKIKQDGWGTIVENAFGYFLNQANKVEENPTGIALFSGTCSKAHGVSIIPENFTKCMTLFTARKTVESNWTNQKDEYITPNEQHPVYSQFCVDAIVYGLFNNSSQQSGLRKIDYKGKLWDINNQFFWLSAQEVMNLAEAHHYDALYKDAKLSKDRFVYNKLAKEGLYNQLSADAKMVLDSANQLLRKSMQMRKLVSENHPEYHLDSFDAGYAQLKIVWKDYFKDEFNDFRKQYAMLNARLHDVVYDLGFLRK